MAVLLNCIVCFHRGGNVLSPMKFTTLGNMGWVEPAKSEWHRCLEPPDGDCPLGSYQKMTSGSVAIPTAEAVALSLMLLHWVVYLSFILWTYQSPWCDTWDNYIKFRWMSPTMSHMFAIPHGSDGDVWWRLLVWGKARPTSEMKLTCRPAQPWSGSSGCLMCLHLPFGGMVDS